MNFMSETNWRETDWNALEEQTRAAILRQTCAESAWLTGASAARSVLRKYSTSFFLVTRFLPPVKRAQVEAIYAGVRYPDEIVDTFPLTPEARIARLAAWRSDYQRALAIDGLQDAVRAGVPCFLALFVQVVRGADIPPAYYESFLHAMARDARPRPFPTLNHLIDEYIYGSAIVVGYFLTHVYGAARDEDFPRAMESARNLGIALQLTNFLRDVIEDHRRGRTYLPLDMLRAEGLERVDPLDTAQLLPLGRVLLLLAGRAEQHYAAAEDNLDAFAEDSRTAINACIRVYRQLNGLIARRPQQQMQERASVPMGAKFRVLPRSKYWRLPLAYLSR